MYFSNDKLQTSPLNHCGKEPNYSFSYFTFISLS